MTLDREMREQAMEILRDTARRFPRAYANCHANHNTHPERLDWIILGMQAVCTAIPARADGAKFGMNGKRGNKEDPSSDALAFGKGSDIIIADVVESAGAHGTDVNKISWNDVTAASTKDGVIMGVVIDPFLWTTEYKYTVGGGGIIDPVKPPPEPIKPAKLPWDRDEILAELEFLDGFYRKELKREKGLWLGAGVDFVAIAEWILNTYQSARFAGKSELEARALYVAKIRESHEWHVKNDPASANRGALPTKKAVE